MIYDEFKIIENVIASYKTSQPPRKLISNEVKLLRKLRDDFPLLVFKPADKNLGLVAMDISRYDQLVMDHLSNARQYRLVSSDCFAKDRLIRWIGREYSEITNNHDLWYSYELAFLKKQKDFSVPAFYCLPKLHKQGSLKGRPIAAATNWYTTPVSIILERRLRPQLHVFETILKNSEQLCLELDLLNSKLPVDRANFFLITGDVTSLYPRINITRLERIVAEFDPTLVEFCKFVCRNSYVEYGSRIYQQLTGIAMGTNAAVSLANLYMAVIIDKLFVACPHVFHYRRFIDDLFLIWTGSLDDWLHFKRILAITEPSIEIIFSEPSNTMAPFLDINVFIDPSHGSLQTTVFQKALNRYHYLTPASCHAPHTFAGFIKGELTRYARLNSRVYGYVHLKRLFFQRLVNRGFSRRFLRPIFTRHTWSSRYDKRLKSDRPILPFVVPYTRRSGMKSLELLFKRMEDTFHRYIPNSKAMLVYSRTPNTQELISSASLSAEHARELARRR